MLLDPGLNLTLRPMAYPRFYEMYRNAIKNTWTVEEIDFQILRGERQQVAGWSAMPQPAQPAQPTRRTIGFRFRRVA